MSQKKSKYAEKCDRGNRMYGPGCCAHTVTDAQVAAAKARAAVERERESDAFRRAAYLASQDLYAIRQRRSLSWDRYMGRF